ncbi:hypothetical protein UNDKW_1387 [Undibacterium sp. KW1]|uniref:PilW family protein n=1 Tax=Undibacterium sp. KW1 TaxID=2058624 RepID=UPI001331EC0D|nr:PilW family protein [Undibacterium sp. KW1]BBB59660.1 hypothetical protein UNDKW_1387 [Undibacterium sp. KW1]
MKMTNLRDQQGRTLVELMISLAIGLIIMLAVSTLYVTNTQTYRVTDDKALMEEDGRLALATLAFNIRMAGYGQLTNGSPSLIAGGGFTNYTGAGQAIEGCTGGFSSATAVPPVCAGGTNPDSFLIRYVIDGLNSNSSGGVPADCLGQAVTTVPAIVENRFYVQLNPVTGRRELYCAGNGGTVPGATNVLPGQPIADNVVDMKVTYGYDQDDNQSVDGFYTAAQLTDVATTVPMPDYQVKDPLTVPAETRALMTNRFFKVLSARVCLVMRSANDNITPTAQKYRDCSGNLVTATDKRLYAAFSSVISLRGRTNGRTL